jgi:hypothetical protein
MHTELTNHSRLHGGDMSCSLVASTVLKNSASAVDGAQQPHAAAVW